MPSWVPPIPTGKLYSPPALKLESALALLIWCYDGIERDGTLTISIEKAAADLGKPYRTVKEWWRAVRDGEWFSEVRDRGRLGFVATFNREWIEWRVMSANYPNTQGQAAALEDEPSRTDEGQSTAPDDLQSPLKDISKTFEGQSTALETSAYKVLMSDQESEESDGAAVTRAPPAAKRKKLPDPNQQHPACVAFHEKTGQRPNAEQAALIADTVSDLERWQGTLTYWLRAGWSKRNADGMVKRYKRVDDRKDTDDDRLGAHQAQSNGALHANGTGPPRSTGGGSAGSGERAPLKRATVDWE